MKQKLQRYNCRDKMSVIPNLSEINFSKEIISAKSRVYHFSVVVEKDKDGYFVFTQQLQGCYFRGDIYEEAIENIWDAIVLNVEDRLNSNEDLRHEGTDLPKLSASGPPARRTQPPRVPPAPASGARGMLNEPTRDANA